MNTNKLQKYILKIKESFLEESDENKKMLDIYFKYIEGSQPPGEGLCQIKLA